MSRTTMLCTEVHCDRCGAGNPHGNDEYGSAHYSDAHPIADSDWRQDDAGQDLCESCYAQEQCARNGGHTLTPWSKPWGSVIDGSYRRSRTCEDCDHSETTVIQAVSS